MKKYLIYAGMFLGSFLVINVGMYFVLSMMQPEASHELSEAADSTAVQSDSLVVALQDTIDNTHEEEALTDSIEPAITEVHETVPEISTHQEDSTLAMAGYDTNESSEMIVEAINEKPAEQEPDNQELPDIESTEIQTAISEPVSSEPIEPEPIYAPNPKEIAKLAKLLEGMKPAEAAAIASRLEVEEIVMLVMKMKDRKAAKMMAELPISTAAMVAQRMSELVEQQGVKS